MACICASKTYTRKIIASLFVIGKIPNISQLYAYIKYSIERKWKIHNNERERTAA